MKCSFPTFLLQFGRKQQPNFTGTFVYERHSKLPANPNLQAGIAFVQTALRGVWGSVSSGQLRKVIAEHPARTEFSRLDSLPSLAALKVCLDEGLIKYNLRRDRWSITAKGRAALV